MGKILFDEYPIVVDRVLARKIGLTEAIVLQQIHYWLEINKKTKNNFIDGRYWTFNSIKDWQEKEFDFVSYDTVKRTLKKLEKLNILKTNMFNKMKGDKTKWYTINYDILEEVCEKELQKKQEETKIRRARAIKAIKEKKTMSAKCPNGTPKVQNALMVSAECPNDECKMPQPIPETTTENSTEISPSSSNTENLIEIFEENICELKKTTKPKFEKLIKSYDKDFIKAVIEECSFNIESFKGFMSAFNSYIDRQCKTGEDVHIAAEKYRKEHRVNKKSNKRKRDNFNNYEQRDYTAEEFSKFEKNLSGNVDPDALKRMKERFPNLNI